MSELRSERAYIAETATNVSERIERARTLHLEITMDDLAGDVAWIARQLARIAREHITKEHPE